MQRAKDAGFTLIELIVTMIIVGILAAIVIPTFMGAREKALISSQKSDLRNMASSVSAYYAEDGHEDAYLSDQLRNGMWVFDELNGAREREVLTHQFSNEQVRLMHDHTWAWGRNNWCVTLKSGDLNSTGTRIPDSRVIATYRYDAQEGLAKGSCPTQSSTDPRLQ